MGSILKREALLKICNFFPHKNGKKNPDIVGKLHTCLYQFYIIYIYMPPSPSNNSKLATKMVQVSSLLRWFQTFEKHESKSKANHLPPRLGGEDEKTSVWYKPTIKIHSLLKKTSHIPFQLHILDVVVLVVLDVVLDVVLEVACAISMQSLCSFQVLEHIPAICIKKLSVELWNRNGHSNKKAL